MATTYVVADYSFFLKTLMVISIVCVAGGVSYSRTIQDNVQWQGFDHHHQRDRLNQRNLINPTRNDRFEIVEYYRDILLGTIFPGFSLYLLLPATSVKTKRKKNK